MSEVLRAVPGQSDAVDLLERSAERPHHAYLFAGPEGSGKQQAARAFAAALLCERGGCGECRACRLALEDRHPNVVLVEPEGRDIRVGDSSDEDGTARWMVGRAYLTAPEPGRTVFRVEQGDRMTEEAADVLLKALEEPPADTVFVLSSARPDEIPDTVRSRCQTVAFRPLQEGFVVETLAGEGVDRDRARLGARLAGGNLGRSRRLARDDEGLAFRNAALDALGEASRGSGGALDAAERLLTAATSIVVASPETTGSASTCRVSGKRSPTELRTSLEPRSSDACSSNARASAGSSWMYGGIKNRSTWEPGRIV